MNLVTHALFRYPRRQLRGMRWIRVSPIPSNVIWGHASAHQSSQVWMPRPYLDELLGQCGICRAIDNVPHIPIAGTPTASAFNEMLRVDLLSADNAIALRATDGFPKLAPSYPARSGGPQEVSGVLRSPWIAKCSGPMCAQTDGGGEWGNEIRADFCARSSFRF